ncbi:4'-phosphopantetheinyl transferase family protein [Flavobacterium granuli]|uniref:4'-phosphopantetheinyl transferase superfamily protein n=1 Tax=Flavobacterium granuli TaxID=280093 RepID=A0A1M5NPQ8_9FLAO|nr:4'-phosphopantetheinyl transferase superfamily protein [Flavobacterium granuli]PRZ23358.1 4'-phosphopantetheinyl transferase superfamily protein [Flavobacterium granuli]SHG91510.1 4'-phosphopantetheinyl transferase superfamily protein [Flavobacterium granuli]
MIGNDIVDLASARKESNWQRPRFLEKIFTDYEQQLILEAENPEIMVWNLWSRKEAAYKIYNRETGIRAFMPLELTCFYENDSLGWVVCQGKTYPTRTSILNDKIHSIAVLKKEFFNQIQLISPIKNIQKINGIPFLVDRSGTILRPVSISHHGRYSACIAIHKLFNT